MNNKQLICLGLLFGSNLVADVKQNDDTLQTSVEVTQGYRRDRLDSKLSVGSGKYSAHLKAHLKDIDVYTTRLGMTARKGDYFLKGYAGYGNVYDGKYHLNAHQKHHSSEHASLRSHINGDYTADFALTFGKDFLLNNGWSLAPTLGYGVYLQDFHLKHGKLRLYHNHHKIAHARTSKSHFKGTWYSPQLGLNVQKEITSDLSAYADYSFMFPLNYHTKIKEKHDDSLSTNNKAYKSFGNIATVGLNWHFAKNWSLCPEFEFMKFYSKGGKFAHKIRQNRTTRTSCEYRLALNYTF